MSRKVITVLAVGAVIALALGVTFGGRVSAFFHSEPFRGSRRA